MEGKINKIETQNKNPINRVLFIITQEEFGGAQKFLYELTTRLSRENYEILVAVGENKKGEFMKSLAQNNIDVKTLRFLKRRVNPILDFLAVIELMKIINKYKPNYLHLNSSKAGILGSISGFMIKNLRFKKFKKLKVIYRIGGWSFNDPWPLWKKKLFIAVEKITARFKDIIVVNNKSDYEQAIKLKIKPRKEIKLIYNGIDALKTEFLNKDEARLKLFKNLSKNHDKIFQADFIVGTVANFYPTKGLEYLVEAVNILKSNLNIKNCKFLIIGDGERKTELESKIASYKLEKDLILVGQIPEADKYMRAFDFFVLPSVKEGLPWVILQAMAAKLPIISTRVGGVPEIIEDGKNGILVEPKEPLEMAKAIKYILENERARQEFGIEAHQTVLFKFPIEKMVRETEVLFSDENHY